MNQTTINLEVSLESLVDSISSLPQEERTKLWERLETKIPNLRIIEFVQPPQRIVNPNPDYQPVGEILTMGEIRDRYPREWVLIADIETDEEINEVIRGEVLVHSGDRDETYAALSKFNHLKSIAIEYTGPLPNDYVVML